MIGLRHSSIRLLEGRRGRGVGDIDGDWRRCCGVARGVAGNGGQGVGAVGDSGGVEGDAVGRGGVLGGNGIVVEPELHACHADVVGGVRAEGDDTGDRSAGRGDGHRGCGGVPAGGGRGLEGGDLHDPGAGRGCGGAVGAGGGDDAVFGDVGVGGGDDAGGEVGAGGGEAADGHAGAEDQRVGGGGRDGAAVGGGAGARGRGADIERVDRIEAAVLQRADVDVGGGGVEGTVTVLVPAAAALMLLA